MERKLNIGIVGLGQFGVHFVDLYRRHPDVGRVALCDIDAGKLTRAAKRFGVDETYDDLGAICRSDLDAIALFTQPWLHAPQAIQVMQSGKHAYSAVPVIMPESGSGDETIEWCGRVIDACRSTGRHYMMGETTYFRPETMYCHARALAGDFGSFVMCEAEYLHDTWLPACNLIEVQMARTGLSEGEVLAIGGDVPMHYPTHSTAAPIAIMDAHMLEVSCMGYAHRADEFWRADSRTGNLFSNEIAQFRMSNGAVARITEGRRIGHVGHEGAVRVLGTDASFERDTSDEYAGTWMTKTSVERVDPRAWREPLPVALADDLGGHGGSHAYLVHEFVRACIENRPPRVNALQAARTVAAGVAAHKSALRDGELVKVVDFA